MTLIDSSVWIHFLRGSALPQVDVLEDLLLSQEAVLGDLMLVEVLQGIKLDHDHELIRRHFGSLHQLVIGGFDVAELAADHFRFLRARGITIRKTIDTLIATRCILDRIPLLHADRDFDAFEQHLGLMVVR